MGDKVIITFQGTRKLARETRVLAAKMDVSRSSLIRQVLEAYIQAERGKTKAGRGLK